MDNELARTRPEPRLANSPIAEPPRAVRRLARVTLLLAVLAFSFLLGRALLQRETDWKPLADGARVRLYQASYGLEHDVRYALNPWYVHFTRDVPMMSRRDFLQGRLWKRLSGSSGGVTQEPMVMLYFQLENHHGLLIYEVEVQEDDGTKFSYGHELPFPHGRSTYRMLDVLLPRFPRKSEMMKVHMRFDGIPHSFEFKNPAYQP